MASRIPRRTFLKGIGTALALPTLEGMLPLNALAQSVPKSAQPVRMAFMFVPNGISMDHWTPTTEGVFELPSVLEPLANVKSDFSILTGLAQMNAFALGDGPGDHARSAATWLTGVHVRKTAGADIHDGISVDQVAAEKVGGATRFASLELGCERGAQAGDCDSGYSCAYSSSISWRGEATPNAHETNPRLVFERLFGDGSADQGESREKRRKYNLSILDLVMDDADRLRARLGIHDKRKMDEYFQAVREIELRLNRADQAKLDKLAAGTPHPAGVPADYGEHVKLMADMMVLAFQGDLTRISTLMFCNDGSNRSYKQIGVPEGHHDMSHHGTDPVKLEKKRQIDRYHVQLLAYALEKMKSIKELDGTMLDHSMVVYGAGISDGDAHNHDNLPVLLAGRGGKSIKTGRHVRYPDRTPMNNLFLSMLDRMGVKIEQLGDSTGRLQQLF